MDIVLIGFFVLFGLFAIWLSRTTRRESMPLFGRDDTAAADRTAMATQAPTPFPTSSLPPTPFAPPPSPPLGETQVLPGSGSAADSRPMDTVSLQRKPRAVAFLVIEAGGKAFTLHPTDTSIGRAGTNDIVVDDPTVGRQQAKIKFKGKEAYLYDLAATNPTLVNGKPVRGRRKLDENDRIQMGTVVFVFKEIKPISGSSGIDPVTGGHLYSGNIYGQIPSRMYEGDASIIVLTIAPRGLSIVPKPPKKYKFVEPLNFISPNQVPLLEVELLAVGVDVSGERKQSKPLYRDRATSFYWNISPPKSGTFEVGFVFRTEGISHQLEEVGMFTTQIVVTKYDGLTNNQARLIAAASGTVAAILGAVEVLFKVGVFSPR